MHILYIVPNTPNLIRVRPYNLICNLTAQGHLVTVMTLSSNEEKDVNDLKEFCHHVYSYPMPTWRSFLNALTAFPTNLPLQSAYCWNPSFAKSSIRLIDNRLVIPPYDVIHIEHLRGARYGLNLKQHLDANKISIPIIWDSVDCITHLFEQAAKLSVNILNRWLVRFELARTRRFEGFLIKQFDRILVTSKVDKDALLSLNQSTDKAPEISVLPNGVDLTYFHPNKMMVREEATLVVSGKMSYHANVTMVQYLVTKIMPLVWARKKDVKLWIVGKNPSREIREFANNPAITITGTVNDIRPYLQSATIAVAPITYGAGIQNKILEAMACGTPVVSSPQGISALAVMPDRDLLIAKEPSDISEKIFSLLERPDLQRKIGECGRRYVEQHHNWENITAQLAGFYADTIDRKRSDVLI